MLSTTAWNFLHDNKLLFLMLLWKMRPGERWLRLQTLTQRLVRRQSVPSVHDNDNGGRWCWEYPGRRSIKLFRNEKRSGRPRSRLINLSALGCCRRIIDKQQRIFNNRMHRKTPSFGTHKASNRPIFYLTSSTKRERRRRGRRRRNKNCGNKIY